MAGITICEATCDPRRILDRDLDRALRLTFPASDPIAIADIAGPPTTPKTLKAKVGEVMTREVVAVTAASSVAEAARAMAEHDVGFLPVLDGRMLTGVVTDRDITVRATASPKPADRTAVESIMSSDVLWCLAAESVEAVARRMGEAQVRRMPVLDDDKRLVGIVSLGDLARHGVAGVADALRLISTRSRTGHRGAKESPSR